MIRDALKALRSVSASVGAILALAGLCATPTASWAMSLFGAHPSQTQAKAAQSNVAATVATAITAALDERRYVDAGELLDQAVAKGVTSPEITVLGGDLLLARGHYADALTMFRSVAAAPDQKAQALEGEGLALSLLGRSDEALADLKEATALDSGLWRAWNALGAEYDARLDWSHAQSAYAKALSAPHVNAAIVLNNRGYSRLLQRRTEEAATDFVAALEKDPSLASARTNLRLTLAIEGHYARASATGAGDDRAAVLNNVGVAAAMRGDYISAEKFLTQAAEAKGQFYARAAENLQISHELQARKEETPSEPEIAR